MTATDILREALDLLDKKGWTQGAWAKDANGVPCSWNSDAAQCYCAEGAMLVATSAAGEEDAIKAHEFLRCVVGGSIPNWNDSRTKPQILAGFGKAIALSEASA